MTIDLLSAYNRLAMLDHIYDWHMIRSNLDLRPLYRERAALEQKLGWKRSWRPWLPDAYVVSCVPPALPLLANGEIDWDAIPVLDMDKFKQEPTKPC